MNTFGNIPTLADHAMWDIVANRLYYAAFHAALSLLINDGHRTATHRGIVALFGLYYIKTGKFSVEEGKMYSRLQTMRDEADYNCTFTATQEDVEPYIEQVRLFLERFRSLLTCLDN